VIPARVATGSPSIPRQRLRRGQHLLLHLPGHTRCDSQRHRQWKLRGVPGEAESHGTAGGLCFDLGGHGDSSAAAVAVDSAGNAYLAGSTGAADFPLTSAAFQKSAAGNTDAFVVKLNPAGSDLVYGTLLGGSGADRAVGLAIDSAGAALVSGSTSSTDFPSRPTLFPSALPEPVSADGRHALRISSPSRTLRRCNLPPSSMPRKHAGVFPPT